ncbi:glycosyltransferase family 2 protein [Psychroserpens sp. Hel_I_66]|uniref:glycosyltransferase family 2 protein n=1 Tax=Psychroserpens sp. Hel_I_66 TaxID=1250004 RepID=UPI0006468B6B|nr:glycosyltransferase family 2 protein [Psychroserpens sp. Hel_I_66]
MNNSYPKISIVVPVKNGIDTLERLIKGVEIQSLFNITEVVIIDSGSTDGSIDYVSKFPFVNVVAIDPKTFNHGATRNLAVKHCKGEFVLMTVQDAWTTDKRLLERMVSHFDDKEVMGVCGHQVVPHIKEFNPHQWYRPQNEAIPKFVQFEKGEFDNLSPKEQFSFCGWDDVISMYRKSALIEIPFLKTDFAEDLLWAKHTLRAGHKIVYDRRNMVNHYHHYFPEYVYKRIFVEKYAIYKHFGYHLDASVPLYKYFNLLLSNLKWKMNPYWFFFNFRALRARNEANHLFDVSLAKGDAYLDKMYQEVCGVIPQGRINKK